MLEEVAVYLVLAPIVAAALALAGLVAWVRHPRPGTARVVGKERISG